MLGMLLDSGNSHTLVEGNGYNTVLVTLIYSRVRNISSRCYGRDYEWRKLYGTTKSREAETLVGQLTINDLITFCSSFGLESHGTQSQLEEHLLYYYATQIGRDKSPFLTPRVRKRKTFGSTIPSESNKTPNLRGQRHLQQHPHPIYNMQGLEYSHERISRVENSLIRWETVSGFVSSQTSRENLLPTSCACMIHL